MKGSQEQARQYEQRARRHRPKPPVLRNVVTAFIAGGAITGLGQMILTFFRVRGLDLREATGATAAVIILAGALLTGLGVYDRLGRWAGMGASLPISGFANSIVAPAMEYKREGMVLGVGARMFTVAGPVIVYGLVISVLAAAVRYALRGP
ncbi:MAG TPA: stage V sporulation protein AC [Sphingobacteriaceae bacterium]|nr:stage V sporulation protein AC [Sphingobacteriaceae bacterium]